MKPVITASATWGRQKQVVNTWKLFFTWSSSSLTKRWWHHNNSGYKSMNSCNLQPATFAAWLPVKRFPSVVCELLDAHDIDPALLHFTLHHHLAIMTPSGCTAAVSRHRTHFSCESDPPTARTIITNDSLPPSLVSPPHPFSQLSPPLSHSLLPYLSPPSPS